MSIREEFFAELESCALWDVGVAINRTNPLPIDKESIFKSFSDAETYAAGPTAYPGQLITVLEEDNTTLYFLNQIKELRKLTSSEDDDNGAIAGYYFNDKFYTDSTYTVELPRIKYRFYIDLNASHHIYTYVGETNYNYRMITPDMASDSVFGVMKLYNTKGNNTDGTMTQKAITDNLNTKVSADVDVADELLVLNIDL